MFQRAFLKRWLNSLFKDHAIFRLFWTNLAPILRTDRKEVWRSNHPTPARLRRYQRTLRLQSVVNLRGLRQSCGSDYLSRRACEELSLPYADMAFESRNFPEKERIFKFYHLWQTLPKPMLLHCKSGADRTGLAAALILLFEGYKTSEAQKQLHWRFLHFRFSRTGVLDLFLKLYEKTGEGKISFISWVANDYDDIFCREILSSRRKQKKKPF